MRTNKTWESGIIAGLAGLTVLVLNLIVIGGTSIIDFGGRYALFMLALLVVDAIAFAAAGLFAGVLVVRYTPGEARPFAAGLFAGCFVAYIPVAILALYAAKALYALLTGAVVPWSDVPVGLAILFTLIAQVAMSGLISFAYASVFSPKGQSDKAAPAAGEDSELIELEATYDDLWKDARTLARDLNNGIQLYLLVGFFSLVYGLVLAAYALSSWQRIYAGSTHLADSAAAIGETIGCVMLLVAGPLLISWYFKLKSRYARLTRIERDAGE